MKRFLCESRFLFLMRLTPLPKLHTRVLLNFLKIIEDKAEFLYQKISCLKSLTVRERIVKYLSTLVKDTPQRPGYTRSQLANYLGISREARSRGLSGMQKEGLIKVNKGTIQILKSEAFCSPLSEHPIQTAQKSRRLPTCEMPEILKICSLPLFKHSLSRGSPSVPPAFPCKMRSTDSRRFSLSRGEHGQQTLFINGRKLIFTV